MRFATLAFAMICSLRPCIIIVGGFYLAQLAPVEAQVGEPQSALNHIEQLLATPAGHVLSTASLRFDPAWDPLRKEPRFQKLCEGK